MAQWTPAASASSEGVGPSRPSWTAVGDALKQLGHELFQQATSKLSQQIDVVTDKLNETAEGAGATGGATLAAGEASLTGKNPLWAAVKGAWSGASAKTKILVVLALPLAVLLLPVALVVLLLGLGYLGIRAAVK